MNARRLSIVALSVALPGCFAPNFPATAVDTDTDATSTGQSESGATLLDTTGVDSSSTGGDSSTTSDDTTTAAADDSSSTGDDSTTGEEPPPAVCGDGRLEGDEMCDDAGLNGVSGMSDCLADCTLTICGDGFLGTPETEECDQGDANGDDAACTSVCANAFCGDNLTGPGEGCDDGPKGSDNCTSECALASCGDGTVQAPEECDDDNESNTDACLNTCVFATCGDGFTEAAEEQCDDGANNTDTPITCAYGTTEDDCTYCEIVSCTTEQGITSYCGDGTLQEDDGELCDGSYTNASCNDCAAGLTCDAGFDNCDDSIANGCEVNTNNTVDSCGSCGHSCGAGGTCTAGVCQTQLLATGGLADVDFYETPDDPSCTASLWYLDTTAGFVGNMCLAGPLVEEPEGEQYTPGFLDFFYQDTLEIAPGGTRLGYLYDNPDFTFSSLIGTANTGFGRRSGVQNSDVGDSGSYGTPATTSHMTAAGSSPSVLASRFVGSGGNPDFICMDALDVPTLAEGESWNEGVCETIDSPSASALVGVRFGGIGSVGAALFAYGNADSGLCLARGTTTGSETGVNPDPEADGGDDDDLEDVVVQCTDIGILLGGVDETVDGLGVTSGLSSVLPVEVFASSDGIGSIRLFETEGGADLDLVYAGDVAAGAEVEPNSEIFVPRPGSDAGDGDEYIYWYHGQTVYRATKATGDTSVEVLHTVPAGEGDLLEVVYYDGFVYYGTSSGIRRRAL